MRARCPGPTIFSTPIWAKPLSHEERFASPDKHAFVNGHAVTFRDADDNVPRYVHMSKATLRLFQEYHDATTPEAGRRRGNGRRC